MKTYFISGLPRSGSTLLCNILNQNPKFHATATSGIVNIMVNIKNTWDTIPELKASSSEEGKKRVLKGILNNYYEGKEVVFDKSRGWLSEMEMLEEVTGEKAKVIVTVRDVRDIISSFEKLWRKNKSSDYFAAQVKNPVQFQTQLGRVEYWLSSESPLGRSHNTIKDALHRGFSDRMFFVMFEDLTTNPEEAMRAVYNFLGEEYYEHDFDNVEQTTHEDDTVHGIKGLHDIRSKVEPVKSDWKEVIGEEFESLDEHNFWDKK